MNAFMRFAAGVAAIAGFLYGYDTGIISSALLQIADAFKLQHGMQEVVASAILAGAVLGALGCGWVSDRFGRKPTIIGIGSLYAVGALAAGLAPDAWLLTAARLVLGVAVGASSQTVPVYVAELAPAASRGNLVTSFNVAIGVGIVVANVVGFSLHGILSWRWMVAAAAVPAAALVGCMLWLPESPRWLVSRHRSEDAGGALGTVRADQGSIRGELDGIEKMSRDTERSDTKGWRGLMAPWVRPALLCGCGVAAFTQLSGIEMMIYYGPTILSQAGFGASGALLSSLGTAIVYLVMTAVGLAVVDRVGRRRLSLVMIPGATVSLLALGALFVLGLSSGAWRWPLVGCLLVYMAFNAGGLQVVGWLTGSEVYPLSVRAAGTSAQAGTVWGADLLVTITALSLVQGIGAGGTMWLYAAMNMAAFAFIWRFVPETAGRSLETIEESLHAGEFQPAK